jgi:hypothetical protein
LHAPVVFPVDGHGCDFWKSRLAVALRTMRPLESRAQVVQRDERGFDFVVLLELDAEREGRLELRARASAAGTMVAARSRARTIRYM